MGLKHLIWIGSRYNSNFALLALLIWAIRDGQFEDRKRMMDGLLYDGVDELRDAVEREKKREELKRKKSQKIDK